MALIEYHPPLEPFLDEVYLDNHILVINKADCFLFQVIAPNILTAQ